MIIVKDLLVDNTLFGGVSSLTSEFIYNNSDNKESIIPVFTGSKQFQNKFINSTAISPKKIFHGSNFTVKLNRKGDVKFATVIREKEFTINDDAYVVYLNQEKMKKLNITTTSFCGFIILNISTFASSESGNGTFNKKSFLESTFDTQKISDYEYAYRFHKNYLALKQSSNILKSVRENSIFIPETFNYAPITDLFQIHRGTSKYTDEFIYNNSDEKDNLIPVYTGSLKFENKYINRSAANKIISSPSIRVLKDGVNAGIAETITNKSYVINSHAVVLTPLNSKLDLEIYSFILRTYIIPILNDPSGNPTLNIQEFENISLPIIFKDSSTSQLSNKIKKFSELESMIYNLL